MSRKILIDDDAAQFANLDLRLKRLEQGIPEDVRFVGATDQPPFQNSWHNLDLTSPPVARAVGFYRDRGRVWLTGIAAGGANNTVVFTLPDGYWPYSSTSSTEMMLAASGGPARLLLSAAGDVTVFNFSTSTVSTWVSFEGVSFRHA